MLDRPDITDLCRQVLEFADRLACIKSSLEPCPFPWYPYYTFGNFPRMENLLSGENRYLLDLIGDDPVADIGCGDGEVAFFLESLGCRVDAFDQPATNYNRMQGVRALKAALHSQVEIQEVDLDLPWTSTRRYGLAFFLGILYHLKNPFGALESLAERARYCFLSTRIARWTPDHHTRLYGASVAYLLGECESNNDPSNFWIFSEAGLRRLLDRTGWEVDALLTIGDTVESEPAHLDHDERAFCFLRSRLLESVAAGAVELGSRLFDEQLGPTWYGREAGMRWMPQCATLRLRGPRSAEQKLYVSGFCPGPQLREGPVEMRVALDGLPLAPAWLLRPEEAFQFSFPLPPDLVGRAEVELEIGVDRTFTQPGDQRELGAALSLIEIR